jgi:hypothetical protein
MREPEYSDTTEFMRWARENKRRADDVVKTAKELLVPGLFIPRGATLLANLLGAITHYEERD